MAHAGSIKICQFSHIDSDSLGAFHKDDLDGVFHKDDPDGVHLPWMQTLEKLPRY